MSSQTTAVQALGGFVILHLLKKIIFWMSDGRDAEHDRAIDCA